MYVSNRYVRSTIESTEMYKMIKIKRALTALFPCFISTSELVEVVYFDDSIRFDAVEEAK